MRAARVTRREDRRGAVVKRWMGETDDRDDRDEDGVVVLIAGGVTLVGLLAVDEEASKWGGCRAPELLECCVEFDWGSKGDASGSRREGGIAMLSEDIMAR